ncbi:cysteinyl-tRNA synthetase [Spiroplasma gladiatoris]|uniref:Cysteine--tRNA ligase n=1 Tax=Spiroplasma gladiatoris TaxID=2143 RepID=A0A4P7AGL8_9MOLU|nr:cysteine--tRNA ligase [Spiroplasma gladiatoris]QBQ07231.1 cysteinyl-tRNA synthetase [Spiroplasma gladiatoris]
MLKIYDSLTGEKKTINDSKVRIYTCGPTVYNYIHIGNARPLILADLVVKFLTFKEVKVKYLLNITDIDDKIINKAIEENVSEFDIAKKYSDAFFNDIENLNITLPTKVIPISSKLIEIIDFIEILIDKKYAYEVNGNVYFDISSLEKEYGELSKQKKEELNTGARVEQDFNKKNSGDFVLWKKTDKGKKWLSKWSYGRPGWHTECALLIDNFFTKPLDIHIGGIDLKFPHHENERIQYIAKNNKEIAIAWAYNGHLSINNEKMSKSLGNTILVKDFIEKYGANELRFIYLNSNYKQPLNITEELINQSIEWNNKIFNLLKLANWKIATKEVILNNQTPIDDDFDSYKYITKFKEFMNDDLNTPMVITLLEEMAKNINKQIKNKVLDKTLEKFKAILNVLGLSYKILDIDKKTKEKLLEWLMLLENKNYEKADIIRKKLQEGGII